MEYLIAAFATFGISYLVTETDGPADIFQKIRRSDKTAVTQCLPCFSFWVALFTALTVANDFGSWLMAVLAFTGAAIFLNNVSQDW
jgi:hypothetical protein